MTLKNKTVFLEELQAFPLLVFVLDWILRRRGPLQVGAGELFVLYGVSPRAKGCVAWLRRCGLPLKVHQLDHDFFDDVALPEKIPALRETYFRAAPSLAQQIESSDLYRGTVEKGVRKPSHAKYLRVAVSKRLFIELSAEVRSVLISQWFFHEKLGGRNGSAVLYLPDRGLLPWLQTYAASRDVQLFALRVSSAGQRVVGVLKRFIRRRQEAWAVFRHRPPQVGPEGPKIRMTAEMYFNGIRPGTLYNTDFFWWKESLFPRGAILAYFTHPGDQPTPERRGQLSSMGIECLDRNQIHGLMNGFEPLRSTSPLLQEAVEEFYAAYERWRCFFITTKTRLHVSSSDHFPQSEALHASLEDLGGISVSLQRSIEFEPRFYRRTVVDVHFAFAKDSADSESLSGSQVRQFIVAGYPFDSVFSRARNASKDWVAGLRSRGASFILCYFDENRGFVPRRFGGRKQNQADYTFLCDRLEEDPTLGLILKPKRPQLLAESLGPVWFRLKGLMDSGRCLYLDGNGIDERYLPCAAAAASDAVINFLEGGTAGLEAALLGKKVFLLRHQEELGLFDQLPPGSVIFEDWTCLWKAIQQLRSEPNHPTLGSWEPVLDHLVSLRDGSSADRIGFYLKELWKALEEGRSREEALERASHSYEERWGTGWIRSLEQAVPQEVVYADA